MSSLACYLDTGSRGMLSAGDELSENQGAEQGMYWTLWNSRFSDDMQASNMYSENNGEGAARCFWAYEHQKSKPSENFAVPGRVPASDSSTRTSSEDQSEGPAVPSEPEHTEQTSDIFLSQFSDEEMRVMDAPFQSLDMFPDSMHSLLSCENLLSGILADFQDQATTFDQNEIDTMDTCGFPMFSHELQDDLSSAESSSPSSVNVKPNSSDVLVDPSKGKAQATATQNARNMEAAVLEELEEVVFQLTKKTRVCFRDAFYRLAESSGKATHASANGARIVGSEKQGFQQSEGTESRASKTSDRPERETNAIDRTVQILTLAA